MKTPVKTIFEQFHSHPDFSKWLAINKEHLMEFEHHLLYEFYWFMLDCDAMTIHEAVDKFLNEHENH